MAQKKHVIHNSGNKPQGFTLVELAIVLMIIGLLIGGILKGQELIQNARITFLIRQLKNYDAATITFMDSYGAKPGDIPNPSTRLPNCSAAKCNVAGDGNGNIGTAQGYGDENMTYWLHLAAANLISGINMDATWTSADYYVATTSAPIIPLGGVNGMFNMSQAAGTMFNQPISGQYYGGMTAVGGMYSVPVNVIMRIDTKIDDGRPWNGDVLLNGAGCGVTVVTGAYSGGNASLCGYIIKAAF